MKYDPDKHNRRSIRLKDHDYSAAGAYFVTLCTQNHACLLGEIIDKEVSLSPLGRIVAESWGWLKQQYSYVEQDAWVVMPNHLHGIILIKDVTGRGASRSALISGGSRTAPTAEQRKPLGRLIGAFKTMSTKRINEILRTPGTVFLQRNYYEHVIPNETTLNAIREYIEANPSRLQDDPDNPNLVE